MKNPPAKVKKFTGYHATFLITAFFAVVVCVNVTMARFAVGTFGGTVVDNSYVASQKYNQWLAEARQQQSLGWTVSPISRVKDKTMVTLMAADGKALEGAAILAVAEHPVGRSQPVNLQFRETSPGIYQSLNGLPDGRWKLRMRISYGGDELSLVQELI